MARSSAVAALRLLEEEAGLVPAEIKDIMRQQGSYKQAVQALSDGRTELVLDNGWSVSKDFGHLAYGYCSTSHASQGKTVDHVLIGQSAGSFPASSREQAYVSISRGRQRATIYTNDKKALLTAISRSDDRQAATEFVNKRARASVLQRQERMAPASPERDTRDRKELEYER